MTPSPCPTCTSLADCGSCLPRLAWEGAQLPEPDECLTCADVEALLAAGLPVAAIAARLGMRPASLTRHLNRHHLPIPDHLRRSA